MKGYNRRQHHNSGRAQRIDAHRARKRQEREELRKAGIAEAKETILSELKGLLEKYGAELGDSGMYEVEGMEVTFDNGNRISYKRCTINALNVMDYEKELE